MTQISLRALAPFIASILIANPALADFEFSGCEGNEETIADSYSLVFSRAKASENLVSDNELYRTWFGEWSEARGETVSSKVADIIAHSLIGTPSFTCYPSGDSECDEDGDGGDDAYAFVFEGGSFEIHLCSSFFTVESDLEIDKTDVLLHELTHFYIGANTDDHCYGDVGPDGCLNLALTEPDLAVENADSYMYFMKNAPN